MFPTPLWNYNLTPLSLHSASLDRPAASTWAPSEKSGLASVLPYPLPRASHPSKDPPLVFEPLTRPMESGTHSSYELAGRCGAALVTRYQTCKEDVLERSAFERYTKKHFDSWVAFSREKVYSNDVKPVLVYGFNTTKDFAMAAFSNDGTSLAVDLTISVPMLGSASASVWRTGLAHTNHGPQQCIPPSSSEPMGMVAQAKEKLKEQRGTGVAKSIKRKAADEGESNAAKKART